MGLAAADKVLIGTGGDQLATAASLETFFDTCPQHFNHWSVVLLFLIFFHFFVLYKFNPGSIYTLYLTLVQAEPFNLHFGIIRLCKNTKNNSHTLNFFPYLACFFKILFLCG